jgi:hypothetical protein
MYEQQQLSKIRSEACRKGGYVQVGKQLPGVDAYIYSPALSNPNDKLFSLLHASAGRSRRSTAHHPSRSIFCMTGCMIRTDFSCETFLPEVDMKHIPGAGVFFEEISFKQATVALYELHVGIRIKLKSRPCRSVQKAI